jgi:hypothetical protein
LAAILSGCAKPCFYQADKNIEKCKRDLLQCVQEANNSRYGPKNTLLSSIEAEMQEEHQPAELTCLCMQERGYEYLDVNKMPQNRKRIMVAAPFQKYWAVDGSGEVSEDLKILSDGAGEVSEDLKILSEQKFQENNSDSHVKRYIRYEMQRDESGELIKDASGNFIFFPVYDEGQRVVATSKQIEEK